MFILFIVEGFLIFSVVILVCVYGAEETDSCKHFGNTDFSKILVIKRARFISPSFLSLKNENNISTQCSASSYASRNYFLSYVLASGGAPGWLRSRSRSSWVQVRHQALCWQLRAWSLLRILCLPLPLCPSPVLTLSLSLSFSLPQKNKH